MCWKTRHEIISSQRNHKHFFTTLLLLRYFSSLHSRNSFCVTISKLAAVSLSTSTCFIHCKITMIYVCKRVSELINVTLKLFAKHNNRWNGNKFRFIRSPSKLKHSKKCTRVIWRWVRLDGYKYVKENFKSISVKNYKKFDFFRCSGLIILFIEFFSCIKFTFL